MYNILSCFFRHLSKPFCLTILILFSFLGTNSFAQTQVTIDTDSTHQVIRGFGAANIVGWRPDMTEDEVNKAFGTGEGQLGFSLLRIRVPHTSYNFYVNETTAKLAYSKGAEIIASPWTPPAGLKSNNNIVGGRLNESSYADYAAHLKSYVDYMADAGVPLYAISVQNEPDIEVDYESCDWNAEEMTKFIGENCSDIGTRLIAPESYNFNKTISNSILNDSAACANVSIIGGHLYGGGLERYWLAEEKGKELWMTEYLVTDTTWASTLSVCSQINSCLRYNMSAYLWWYIVRFYGPIDENSNITKRGYAMSQFARFIRPGFTRVQADYTQEIGVSVSFSAYKSDSSTVIIAINNMNEPREVEFNFENNSYASFTPYVTSKVKDCEEGTAGEILNNGFTYTLEDSCITTFVLKNNPTDVKDNLTEVEKTFSLSQNYPNPFNPSTTINFSIPDAGFVSLKVYDLLGREIKTLVNKQMTPGSYSVELNASDLPSGIYFYTMKSGNNIATKKLMLLK